jgi:hypothetical protein
MKVEEALKKLNEVGLVAEFLGGSDKRIIGGTERTNELGFNVYSNSFAIYREDDTWLVVVTGPGQLDTTKRTATLTEAISKTCQLYEAQKAKIAAR